MIELAGCPKEPLLFPPGPTRCPHCGGKTRVVRVDGKGRVAACTALEVPAEGWTAPHVLCVVELEPAGRLLTLGRGPRPTVGSPGRVALDAEGRYVFEPSAP